MHEETLRVTVPEDKYVKVSSPGNEAEVARANGQVTYSWMSSTAEAPKHSEKQIPRRLQGVPDIQITSFRNWDQVGRWYGSLAKPQSQVTSEIQAQALQLTRGLTTDIEKERAIYQFVSSKIRYIAIDFGAGRYQPHLAAEVLANRYGDCKDKHTLPAALLKAAGIEAWPVLIGAGLSFDPDVPSPAQFNHLITYLPGNGTPIWLDATPEDVPFEMLSAALRGQKALVIPDNGSANVMTTPEALPFAADVSMEVAGKLDSKGTLSAHFDWTFRGDSEVALRSVFRAAGPAKWADLTGCGKKQIPG